MKLTTILKALLLTVFSLFINEYVQSQENTLTTGGLASGDGGTSSYSVGQTFYTQSHNNDYSITCGLQQAFEISEISSIEESIKTSILCSAYPNPVVDNLKLEIISDHFISSNFSFQIYDINGKIILYQNITTNETSIEMSELTPATYFLKIFNNTREIKVFKIVKK